MAAAKGNGKGEPELSYEQAAARVEEIVQALESGGLTLDESLARYEEAVGLYRRLVQVLAAAEQRIQVLTQEGGLRPAAGLVPTLEPAPAPPEDAPTCEDPFSDE